MNQEMQNWFKEKTGVASILNIKRFKSAEQNEVYEVDTESRTYFYKRGPRLSDERERLIWLADKISVPEAIAWREIDLNQSDLIMSAVEGQSLSSLVSTLQQNEIIDLLASTLRTLHAIDINDCPFGVPSKDAVLTHGDACLPNFIYNNGVFSGTIDAGAASIGNPEIDLAAAVWSLAYNYGPGLGLRFLRAYGIADAVESDEVRLIKKYEPTWSGY